MLFEEHAGPPSEVRLVKSHGRTEGADVKVTIHDGAFHADDMMCLAILCLTFPGRIDVLRTRKEDLLAASLDDPECWVVDVGGVYDPSARNLDHHAAEADPPERAAPSDLCSCEMLCDALAGTPEGAWTLGLQPFLSALSSNDRKGGGTPLARAVSRLNGPADCAIPQAISVCAHFASSVTCRLGYAPIHHPLPFFSLEAATPSAGAGGEAAVVLTPIDPPPYRGGSVPLEFSGAHGGPWACPALGALSQITSVMPNDELALNCLTRDETPRLDIVFIPDPEDRHCAATVRSAAGGGVFQRGMITSDPEREGQARFTSFRDGSSALKVSIPDVFPAHKIEWAHDSGFMAKLRMTPEEALDLLVPPGEVEKHILTPEQWDKLTENVRARSTSASRPPLMCNHPGGTWGMSRLDWVPPPGGNLITMKMLDVEATVPRGTRWVHGFNPLTTLEDVAAAVGRPISGKIFPKSVALDWYRERSDVDAKDVHAGLTAGGRWVPVGPPSAPLALSLFEFEAGVELYLFVAKPDGTHHLSLVPRNQLWTFYNILQG